MILENPFSQKEFESTFLEGGVLTKNSIRRKRRNRLFIKKVDEYKYEVTTTYRFIRLGAADVLYQFDTDGYLIKISMKINWLLDILIYFLVLPLILLGVNYFEDKSIKPFIEFLPILLGLILFVYGVQVYFYFFSTKDIKSDIELEILKNQYNINE